MPFSRKRPLSIQSAGPSVARGLTEPSVLMIKPAVRQSLEKRAEAGFGMVGLTLFALGTSVLLGVGALAIVRRRRTR